MKKLLSLATAGIIGTATLCSTAQANQLTSADKEFLFNNPSVAKAETLSPEEMKNTEGAWVFGVLLGGIMGLGWYLYSTPYENWNFFDATKSTLLGAAFEFGGSAISGIRVLGWYKNTGGFGISFGKPWVWNPHKWYKNSNQYLRIDIHPLKNRPWYQSFHYHRHPGFQKYHRPWDRW